MRLNYDEEDKVEVQMSPLIDCVFLLLIFFLVTTMMKKWEMQIPLSLPSMTSQLVYHPRRRGSCYHSSG
ncbi:biopolymer transporter ExbD [Bacteroides thetaiotaomicron]|nr:biopolymer transporter ExbD [Bacteroides thetaiotaomicron]